MSSLQYIRQFFGSVLFIAGMVIFSFIWIIPSIIVNLFPYETRVWFVSRWNVFNLWWCKVCCGLDYKITGTENIPDHACIVMPNHQSTWETLALSKILPPLTWVVKRELLWIPLFGWGLAAMAPIALNRQAGKKALMQLINDGRERLQLGRWILIFPEGTRTLPRTQTPLKNGAFLLASKTGATVLPIAHNSGLFWARKQFVKKRGTIQVIIGKPIDTKGKKAEQIKEEYETWLTEQRSKIE